MADITVKGAAFPGSPASGDVFFRTDSDLMTWFGYDGSNWLSSEHLLSFGDDTITTDGYMSISHWVGDDYQIVSTRNAIRTNVSTTNDGSHYWTVTVRSLPLSGATSDAETLYQITTDSDSPDTNVDHDGDSTTNIPTNYGNLWIYCAATGTPGNLTVRASTYFRLRST